MPLADLTRRDFLHGALATAPALAAASALAPLVSSRSVAKDQDAIKVGLLHSLTGFIAISESTLRDAEVLAIEEINKSGGVLGKKIEPVIEDTKSDLLDGFSEKARKLLEKDKVACVFGCWTSASRKSVLPVFEKNNGLLFFPVAYEGNECSKNVIYTGAVPNQQVLPAVDWLASKDGGSKKKFYLLGSDYIYPRMAGQIITAHLKAKHQLKPVGEKYTPLGHRDYQEVVADIKQAKPDVIFNTINGDSNIPFFKELAAAGIKPAEVPVMSTLIGEDELRGLGPEMVKGHLAARNYFQSVDSQANKAFVAAFKKKYGQDRATEEAIEAAYFSVYLWKSAVEKAKSTDVDKVREALRNLELKAPGETVKVDGKNLHTWRPFRVGRIRADRQFDVVYDSKASLWPDPYPQVAFPGWSCDWSKGGVIKP